MTKKTISMPDYVAKVALEKSKVMFGGNFSNYLQWLICKDNTDEIKKLLLIEEMKKPKKISEVRTAEFNSKCATCGKKINVGDKICNAVFPDGHEQYVHLDCCREYT